MKVKAEIQLLLRELPELDQYQVETPQELSSQDLKEMAIRREGHYWVES